MKLDEFPANFQRLPGAMPIWHGAVDAATFRDLCVQVANSGGKLVALWGTDDRTAHGGYGVHIALVTALGLLSLSLAVSGDNPQFPDISDVFPGATRMQRALHDMLGVRAENADDQRKWLRHASWPADVFPLRKDARFVFRVSSSAPETNQPETQNSKPETDNYPFVTVTGDGVHEIPVGPVHAGTIEPGHFRFSIIGERVLRLEERLGYKHKGAEKLFETMSIGQGAKLAGRISGDSTVAYAWAYAQAVESVTQTPPPQRAQWLRALFLELERLHNHLGDLGYLGNDVALAFGFAQFWILKEEALRLSQALFGHRYLMDRVIPGGVTHDLTREGVQQIHQVAAHLADEVKRLKDIYDEHAGVQDRFLTTGRVTPDLAAQLGLTGLPGRASAQAWDARAQFPCTPYDQLDVSMATHRNGDVAARVTVRFEETLESLRLIRLIADKIPQGELHVELPSVPENTLGIGWVEGWRGEVLVALHTGKDGGIHRLHPHDPSWQNWPLLEHAIIGNIVPDFPLINKSFNLSYSGQDL